MNETTFITKDGKKRKKVFNRYFSIDTDVTHTGYVYNAEYKKVSPYTEVMLLTFEVDKHGTEEPLGIDTICFYPEAQSMNGKQFEIDLNKIKNQVSYFQGFMTFLRDNNGFEGYNLMFEEGITFKDNCNHLKKILEGAKVNITCLQDDTTGEDYFCIQIVD